MCDVFRQLKQDIWYGCNTEFELQMFDEIPVLKKYLIYGWYSATVFHWASICICECSARGTVPDDWQQYHWRRSVQSPRTTSYMMSGELEVINYAYHWFIGRNIQPCLHCISLFNSALWCALLVSNIIMMKSSNGNIFRVTGHLCGEFTGLRWIPHTKASDAELWCFLWSVSK